MSNTELTELMVIEACAAKLARTTTNQEIEDLALLVARLATLIQETQAAA